MSSKKYLIEDIESLEYLSLVNLVTFYRKELTQLIHERRITDKNLKLMLKNHEIIFYDFKKKKFYPTPETLKILEGLE